MHHTAADMQIAWAECFRELVKLGYTLDYVRPVMERYAKKWIDRRYCEICAPIIKT
jgi:DNA gyrase inhibitor GyrI